jgi:3-methyl-2-oxobutanoate hydroxymethyltransferase
VLVCYDLLGMNPDFKPRFVKRYADLYGQIKGAAEAFFGEVRTQAFPDEAHSFKSKTIHLVASNPEVPPASPGEEGKAADGEKVQIYGVPV